MLWTNIILALLSSLTAAQQEYSFSGSVGASLSGPCLGTAESYLIALRWLQIFQTDSQGQGTGPAIVPSTLSTNFTYYDEGASLGDPAPYYSSAAQVTKAVSGTGYSGGYVTNVQYTILDWFESCDVVTVRWQSDSKASNATEVTVKVGTPVTYKGTDYLEVDLSTRLIYNVTSSSDLLNWYIGLGWDIIADQTSKKRKRT